ncbi:MAG: hypothetical protein Tsb006_3020 [Rickettsiaceae bacterium]
MQNKPALTTTTAWSRALTGYIATIAEGSQLCIGKMAALAVPKMIISNNNIACESLK